MFFSKKHKKDKHKEDSSSQDGLSQTDTNSNISDKQNQNSKKMQSAPKSDSITHARQVGLLTDVGQKREVDEDSIMAVKISTGINSENNLFHILVVADGMGGHARGEEASKIALNAISKTVIPRLFDNVPYTRLLEEGIQSANSNILEHVANNPEAHGMGTTSVCAIVKDNKVHIANIGDSRAYVISTDQIRRITKDHSYVQALVDDGKITKEEAYTHPKKNIITQAIGAASTAEPDTMQLTLADDEHLLLCCDGVIAHLSDEDIQNAVIKYANPQEACRRIIDVANKRGGTDNISVVLLSSEIRDIE